jgi:hypothetical protein
MLPGAPDVARIRFDNALLLFDEFVRATARHADAATLRGLEGRFAERLQIQPSYWSQIKGRSRQIGERLARRFEQLSHKPHGWMDRLHDDTGSAREARATPVAGATHAEAEPSWNVPKDEDERFIVGLVLTYYRRHPERARERLLGLLGEVLSRPVDPKPAAGVKSGAGSATPADDGSQLWSRARAAVAPLKRKR